MVAGIIVTVCIVLILLCLFVCFRSYRWYQHHLWLQRQAPPNFPAISVAYSTPTNTVSTFLTVPPSTDPEVLVVTNPKVTFTEPPPPYPGLTEPSAALPTYDQLPGSANLPTMGSLFSKKSREPSLQSRVTEKDHVILQLKTQRDKMKMYVRKNEKATEKDREVAKQLLKAGKKDRALILLKKKKYIDQMIDRTLKQLGQIENMVQDLEFAEIEQRVLEGLKNGNEALKEMNKMFSIEDVEKIMDDTREAAEYQEEISNLIAGGLSQSDLADVEEEFEKLVSAEAEDISLPEVPTEELEPATAEREPAAVRGKEKAKRERVLVAAD